MEMVRSRAAWQSVDETKALMLKETRVAVLPQQDFKNRSMQRELKNVFLF